MSIDATVTALVSAANGLAGLRRAYANPPEALNEFPAAIVYVADGSFGELSGRAVCEANTSTFVLELYLSRQALPAAVGAARLWPEPVFAALKASNLNIRYPVAWQMGPLAYGGETLFGLRFRIPIKE